VNKQAIYDFDGTITSKDTTLLLMVELFKLRPWRFPRVIWFLLRIKFSDDNISKQGYKNSAIGYLIKGLDDTCLRMALQEFRARVKSLYRSLVMVSIDEAIRDGCTVLIVTASPSFAVRQCMSDIPVIVLGTEFEKVENIYTGTLSSENCYGKEKVHRINEWAKLNNITLSVKAAWSDHFSDFDMLSLSVNRYWIGREHFQKLVMERDPKANFVHSEH
jgi:phosphatidylglycerophosphatase C